MTGASRGTAEIQDELARIAQRIRRWREDAGYTLQELARRSGVAAGTIQKVETRQMVPTVGVLLKIGRGLGRLPSELVRSGDGEVEVMHLSAKQRPRIPLGDRGEVERLTGDLFEPNLEAWRVTLNPGMHVARKNPVRFDGEEFVFCEVGQVTFEIAGEAYDLAPGDSLHFKAVLPHSIANRGEVPTRFVALASVPQALREAFTPPARPRSA